MTICDRKTLKQTAARRLSAAAYKPSKLILIHSGIALGASLLLAILNYIITWQIDANGGGLAGMELRSILETAQKVLSVAYTILTPFWNMGLIYGVLRLSQGKAAYPQSLLEGFRCKGPVLRLLLVQGLIYGAITLAAMYGAYFLYGMTPDGTAFTEAFLKLYLSGEYETYLELFEAIPQPVIERVARGYLPIFAVVLVGLMIPASYRLRMAPYVLMDKYGTGAWKAVRTSGRITKRSCLRLFMLDLSYWWYYLLGLLFLLPAYADVLLLLVGIKLPVDTAVLYIVGNVLYAVLTLAFECLARPKVETAYALAYDALLGQYERTDPHQPEVVDSSGYTVGGEE